MGFHGGMSVIQMETGKCPATHMLDGISWRHVSDSNRDWEVPSNSQAGWDFMEACQCNSNGGMSLGSAQQLTSWMGFHEGMSVIQIEPGKCPATHRLDGISWRHVSDSNRAWEVPRNSQAGWDFIGHVSDSNRAWEVPSNSHAGWDFMEHVSDSNGDWEVPSNSHAGWDFMEACQ
jgi:hypothetical protein